MNASTQLPATGAGPAGTEAVAPVLTGAPAPSAAEHGAGDAAPAAQPLRADCIADSAGGLTFDITAPQGTRPVWSAALVLRPRGDGDSAAHEELRLPLGPNGSGRLRAVLPSTVALPEGRWNVYADLGDGRDPQRLLPGDNDLRPLVDRRPLAGIGRLGVRIPYTTRSGSLALRSWLRGPHAEAADIVVDAGGTTVTGRLYGAVLGPGARAEARLRGGAAEADEVAPVVTVPLTGDGCEFTFTLPYVPLAERWEGGDARWDLWLRAAEGAEPVRIGRLLDDVPEKKAVFVHPALPVGCSAGQLRIGPYYTLDNDLTIRVTDDGPDSTGC
ncbi:MULTISPECIES: hypothetical protein [Streptomyces]|uniref:Transferase n=3 Tax=Streptomyces TaxID=1883 RepID=A0A8A1UI88_STRR1|nr:MULTISPECIES: hypothetical protein [Streptomyces]KEF04094.1 hypothetical protein DF17_25520 [Streptomyces rimosus]QDA07743.1 hypothetical protein CTZ40_32345 [Streptomyces rimosus]QEV79023.1 hypothetical protein CP984_32315 [Streptomyces rimosus]QGY67135.1 hypothetical protein V519_015515 [Streptomyces rimosus R6-500]QST80223.1 hypothetical protein SRIM_008595 [Streptomyces rimosus subsp. rimosus ATCC 10970]